VDYMTKSAQQALKYILQTFDYNNVRFFLICNYISKIDESLQKEFITIQFNRLPANDVLRFLMNICNKEEIDTTEEKVKKIMSLYHHDVRGMIKFIQLNQENIMDEEVWERLNELFAAIAPPYTDHCNDIEEYIRHVSEMYNMEEKQIIKQYLDYIMQSPRHYQMIKTDFIDFVEIIVHNLNNEILLPFFVVNMKKFYI
jgi:DNA polymerase III delta prime subunit